MYDNIVALIGMPRSGTTIISRLISNHSRMDKIIEPYQSRRDADYCEIEPGRLCSDFGITEQKNRSLLVKETSTRPVNIERIANLLDASSQGGYRGAYIFVLRSPLEAFLSQVDAVSTLWQRKSNFDRSSKSLAGFWNSFSNSMQHYANFALRFHRRFIVFDRFVQQPSQEIGRAMGLFGYPFEPAQLDISAVDKSFGGDPKARQASAGPISKGDHFRAEAVALLTADFAGIPEFEVMRRMHQYVKDISLDQPPSDAIIRDLLLLVGRGYT
jgi:hypothetical protein